VNETINASVVVFTDTEEGGFLLGYGVFNPISVVFAMIGVSVWLQRKELADDEYDVLGEHPCKPIDNP
jgi:hypothetical protein